MQDIVELNIPNVCFSLFNELNKDDKRQEIFKQQRLERGFDDSETWNLDYTIASFILPRLQRFKEISMIVPTKLTEEQWDEYLDKMINAFKHIVNRNELDWTKEVDKEIKEGLSLFAEWFTDLWW